MNKYYHLLGLQVSLILNFLGELPAASSYAIYR